VSNTLDEMLSQTRKLIEAIDSQQPIYNTQLAKQQLHYYLYRDDIPYANRLKNLVDAISQEIINNTATQAEQPVTV
jgi:hypothetical protein